MEQRTTAPSFRGFIIICNFLFLIKFYKIVLIKEKGGRVKRKTIWLKI